MRRLIFCIIELFLIFPIYGQTLAEAMDAVQNAESSGNFVEEISIANLVNLPVGIHKTTGNIPMTLAVSKVTFKETYAEIDVYARFEIPQKITLFFGAQKIKLSYDGDFIGDARLVLLDDIEFPAFSDNSLRMILRGGINADGTAQELSYVNLTCSGVSDFGLAVDLEFSDKFLLPVDNYGNIINGQSLKTSFRTQVQNLDNILVEVNLPPFAVSGLEGFSFACQNLVFDFSNDANSSMVKFPTGYIQNYLSNSEINLWRGFYAANIMVSLPTQFKNKDSKERISFAAQDLIIDDYGLSGLFSVQGPILSIDKGDASGWAFSVDGFRLGLEANSLTEAGFNGTICIPVGSGEKNRLKYDGLFDVKNNYYLTVEVADNIDFDVLSAKARIKKESYIKLQVIDGVFRPEALLNGYIDINVASKNSQDSAKANFNGIEFQNLKLQTVIPYFSADYFGYKGNASITGIPVSITELGLRSTGTNLDFYCGVGVQFGDVVKAATNVTFRGKMDVVDGRQSWIFDKFILNDLSVDAVIAETFSLKGSINMYDDDPIYGNGFGGKLNMGFAKVLEGLNISCEAKFGNKGFDYWMADARAEFPGGIPCGPVTIFGFSGGASMCMKRDGLGGLKSNYVPDSNLGLGLKAGIMASLCDKSLISAEATFEILFNKHHGLNFIGLYGNAKFLSGFKIGDLGEKAASVLAKVEEIEKGMTNGNPDLINKLNVDKASNPQESCSKLISSDNKNVDGMQADIVLQYDFNNSAFHAQIDMAVNFAGIVRGSGDNYSAGSAVLHIDPSIWYLYIGRPDNPIALEIGIENFMYVNASSYFMAGQNLPGSPAPPKQVADILGVELSSLNYMRDLNALNKGKGLAFGSQFSLDTGDLFFLIAYARFQTGLGFDIMLKDYENAQCAGRSGSIGMDGWYANGQIYAFLSGELGIGINLFFIKAKFPIIKGGTAAILQGMLPNPTWLRGQLGFRFDLLGGLIKGSMDFKFELGQKCDLLRPGQTPLDMEIIGDINPEGTDIDVFSAPQVAFNAPINKAFSYKREANSTSMRIILHHFSVTDNDGKQVKGNYKWNDTKDKLTFYPIDVLSPNTTYNLDVELNFEELVNGSWQIVYTSGELSRETRTVSFVTGAAPDYIPLKNVQYMYPVKDQHNFHPKEYSKGFVQLKQGQPYLFTTDMIYSAEFITEEGTSAASVALTYNASVRCLNFSIPNNLPLATEYTLTLVCKPKDAVNIINEATYTSVSSETDIKAKQNQSDVLSNDDIGKVILDYPMRTSRYSTFKERISSIKKKEEMYYKVNSEVISLGYRISLDENFDKIEVFGSEFTNDSALIRLSSTGTDKYYKNDIYPHIYQFCPFKPTYREANDYGVPPLKAIEANFDYMNQRNTNEEIMYSDIFPWIYNLPAYYYYDMNDFVDQALNDHVEKTVSIHSYLQQLLQPFAFIRNDDYKCNMMYTLPNNKITTKQLFQFTNDLK